MKNLTFRIASIMIISTLFVGCDDGSGVPGCGDDVIESQLSNMLIKQKYPRYSTEDKKRIKFKYWMTSTSMHDEEHKIKYCSTFLENYGAKKQISGTMDYEIEYNDNGEYKVKITNLNDLNDLFK